jgi:hypothetical protein
MNAPLPITQAQANVHGALTALEAAKALHPANPGAVAEATKTLHEAQRALHGTAQQMESPRPGSSATHQDTHGDRLAGPAIGPHGEQEGLHEPRPQDAQRPK